MTFGIQLKFDQTYPVQPSIQTGNTLSVCLQMSEPSVSSCPTFGDDPLPPSEAQFQELAQQQALLYQISQQIRQSLRLDQILQTTVREVRRLFATDRVLIYQFGDSWQGQVVVEDVGDSWLPTLGEMGADSCFPEKYAALYSGGHVRAIADIETAGLDECHVSYLRGLQVRSNLIVPILVRDHLWGLLIAHQCSGARHWRQSETELLQALSEQVGVAIRQAELYEQARVSAEVAQRQAQQLELTLQQLKKTQAQLIQTEKMSSLGQLVAGIAHEINNPVNFIYGNMVYLKDYVQGLSELIELYRSHYPEPDDAIAAKIEAIDLDFVLQDLPNILKSVQGGSERIYQMVLSLRNFSRLDQAAMKAVDIHEGLESTLRLLQHRLRNDRKWTPAVLHRNYGQLPLVECYPSQLNQVFMNILVNAFDAIEQQAVQQPEQRFEPQISIATEADSDWAYIRISDNGPGMSPEVQRHLFDPFFTTKPVGQGLGLSISHQIIVETHHGLLSYQSELGQGTEFCIAIPLQQPRLGLKLAA